MELDAQTFAEWDVDYVKLDGCNAEPKTMDEGYPRFGKYLNDTGRPMVYSCSWPVYQEEIGMAVSAKDLFKTYLLVSLFLLSSVFGPNGIALNGSKTIIILISVVASRPILKLNP